MTFYQTKIIKPQLLQNQPESKSQNPNSFDEKIKALLSFKEARDACYFVVNKNFTVEDDIDFEIASGAILVFSDIEIKPLHEYYNFMVVYRKDTNMNEGLICIRTNTLIKYISTGIVTALSTSNGKPDKEFINLIREYKENGANR